MSEVQEVNLEQRVAELESKLDSISKRHTEFETVHTSRRGVAGGRGETGPAGPVGPPADVNQVAEVAAEIVQKAWRYETQVSKFENLIKEFESEIVALRAALKFAIIEELQLSGFVDSEGRAVSGPAGADSQVPGPQGERGEQGLQGNAGKNGVDGVTGRDGNDGVKGERGLQGEPGVSNIPGPQGERGEIGPEGLQGLPGAGLGKTEIIELVRDLKRRGTI